MSHLLVMQPLCNRVHPLLEIDVALLPKFCIVAPIDALLIQAGDDAIHILPFGLGWLPNFSLLLIIVRILIITIVVLLVIMTSTSSMLFGFK